MLNKAMLDASAVEQERWLTQARVQVLELFESLEMVLNRLVSRLSGSGVSVQRKKSVEGGQDVWLVVLKRWMSVDVL